MLTSGGDLKIKPTGSVRQQVYENIRLAITTLRLQPGERLTERELIELTGASRTSVREALRELETDGLVKSVPPNRLIVAFPSTDEIVELYAIRGLLESLEMRRFAEMANDDEIAQLKTIQVEYRGAAEVESRLAAKDALYELLGRRSPTVHGVLVGLHARIAMLRNLSLSEPGRHEKSVEEMAMIIDAIAARDADRAERLCVEHAEHAYAAVTDLLSRHPMYRHLVAGV